MAEPVVIEVILESEQGRVVPSAVERLSTWADEHGAIVTGSARPLVDGLHFVEVTAAPRSLGEDLLIELCNLEFVAGAYFKADTEPG